MAGRKKHQTKRITYKDPKPLVRRLKPKGDVDLEEATRMLEESLDRHTNTIPPNGKCQKCGKPVPKMRRLCGSCNAKGRM